MKEEHISWDDFKLLISNHINKELGPRICRGQAKGKDWSLVTSFHRSPNGVTFPAYFSILANLADKIGTIEKRTIDITDDKSRGAFVAYLQHHGYPTPLLDWSLSPYIATFFAFDDLKCLESEYIAIYIFDYLKWILHWEQIRDYSSAIRHVTILAPNSNGNMRQLVQQGAYYTFTNTEDIEAHIIESEKQSKTDFLEKYYISSSERTYVLTELELMGISRFSLFGSTDSFCHTYRDAIFVRTKDGEGAIERLRKRLLEYNKE